jgi:hypothetical protein
MLDEIKNIIKSMLILLAFMLMTGFLLLHMHAINEENNLSKKDNTETINENNKVVNDINGVNESLTNYYSVNDSI